MEFAPCKLTSPVSMLLPWWTERESFGCRELPFLSCLLDLKVTGELSDWLVNETPQQKKILQQNDMKLLSKFNRWTNKCYSWQLPSTWKSRVWICHWCCSKLEDWLELLTWPAGKLQGRYPQSGDNSSNLNIKFQMVKENITYKKRKRNVFRPMIYSIQG